MSHKSKLQQKLFGSNNKNYLLTFLIVTTFVSTISTTDENEKCFFRSGRRLIAGTCIPTSTEDKCCRDQQFAIGICQDSANICCFDYDSNCDNGMYCILWFIFVFICVFLVILIWEVIKSSIVWKVFGLGISKSIILFTLEIISF